MTTNTSGTTASGRTKLEPLEKPPLLLEAPVQTELSNGTSLHVDSSSASKPLLPSLKTENPSQTTVENSQSIEIVSSTSSTKKTIKPWSALRKIQTLQKLQVADKSFREIKFEESVPYLADLPEYHEERLAARGLLVLCVGFRRFPFWGNIGDSMHDVNLSMCWIMDNIEDHGGDKKDVTLVGQGKVGGQLTTLVCLHQAERLIVELETEIHYKPIVKAHLELRKAVSTVSRFIGGFPSWLPRLLKAHISLSGVYNCDESLKELQSTHFRHHFFLRSLAVRRSSSDVSNTELFSPLKVIDRPLFRCSHTNDLMEHVLPKMLLMHGTADKGSGWELAKSFCDTLRTQGFVAELKLYEKSYMDTILTDRFRMQDQILDDIFSQIVPTAESSGEPPGGAVDDGKLVTLAAQLCHN
ncbi:hypothetical protein CYMTET_45035 [Cymbomonas tetramitiformis]|uniref:Uncharacterized protein n=1 Tax=Cymbomonas tetramitiformis TaxID=36881 RepID=A0AAE0EYF7_9CHLO|nr:hypothetical protein CYMTET_47042 [Cymbomonas tetramitiformis]KAK3245391.1 hypothetical protein CYMTET_45035 [Cymbomonas tetramitiformis]